MEYLMGFMSMYCLELLVNEHNLNFKWILSWSWIYSICIRQSMQELKLHTGVYCICKKRLLFTG